MPIVGMTRRQDVTPQIPTLGKLRKGGPKTDPKRPGPDLEYWRFTSEVPDVEAAFYAAYPNNPKVIEAYLPFARMENNWSTWFEEYEAGGMVHRCDGQTMNRWRRPDGSFQDGEKPCPYFNGEKQHTKERPGCKQVGRLQLIIPALIKAGHVGFVTMETHSINDLVSITACLLDIEKRAGKLNGILMSIMRVPQTISTPAWKEEDKTAGKRNRTKKWLVRVVPAAEWVQAQLARQHDEQMALASGVPLQLAVTAETLAVDEAQWNEQDDDEGDEGDEPPSDAEEAEFKALVSADAERATAAAVDPAQQIIKRLRSLGSNDARPLDAMASKRLWGNLNNLTGRNERRGKELLHLVYEVDHSEQLTLGQANALIGWINSRPVKDVNGKVAEWAPFGPALSANEYAILFPPDPGLDLEGASQ